MNQATATVQVETAAVRVTRWDFPPMSHTGHHVHDHDYVVVPITDGVLTITDPDGEVVESPIAVGQTYARSAGVAHDVANRSDAIVAFVEIELLDHRAMA